jgi:energy-converting hydrogenase Eha subunit C
LIGDAFTLTVFVRVVSLTILIVSSIAIVLGGMELILGEGPEKLQALIVISSGLFGVLSAGVAWVIANIGDCVVLMARTLKLTPAT